jgi:lipopolysaccharide/colanic/teichoic acid biosynthesis glycosyltransferase
MDEVRMSIGPIQTSAAAKIEELEWNLPGTLVWGQQAKHFQMAFKRIIDVLVASFLLVIMAVPMALVAIAIRIDSPGPIFYPHERIGCNGKHFRMYKFRSMYVDAAAAKAGLLDQNQTDAPLFKMIDDPRRTRVGRLIRRFSIDEFPQLFNVIFGQMSLVGPRPALPEEAAQYTDLPRPPRRSGPRHDRPLAGQRSQPPHFRQHGGAGCPLRDELVDQAGHLYSAQDHPRHPLRQRRLLTPRKIGPSRGRHAVLRHPISVTCSGRLSIHQMLADPGRLSPVPCIPAPLIVEHMDGRNLRFEENVFDIVFFSSSIEHLGSRENVPHIVLQSGESTWTYYHLALTKAS